MTGRAWLFVREDSSVWLQRASEDGAVLWIRGPGGHRRDYTFDSGEQLLAFVAAAEERLRAAGWIGNEFGPGEDRRRTRSVVSSMERRSVTDRSGSRSGDSPRGS
jgi:hypothetical protein